MTMKRIFATAAAAAFASLIIVANAYAVNDMFLKIEGGADLESKDTDGAFERIQVEQILWGQNKRVSAPRSKNPGIVTVDLKRNRATNPVRRYYRKNRNIPKLVLWIGEGENTQQITLVDARISKINRVRHDTGTGHEFRERVSFSYDQMEWDNVQNVKW